MFFVDLKKQFVFRVTLILILLDLILNKIDQRLLYSYCHIVPYRFYVSILQISKITLDVEIDISGNKNEFIIK